MIGSYFALLRGEPRLLAFGAACAFLSSPGQTYFISQFNTAVGRDLGLAAGELGTVYLVGTLGAAMLLPLVGHWIDRVDLRRFVAVALLGLGLACAVKAVAGGVVGLALAWMGLRLTGQGLMTHTAATSIARYFAATRGRALSLVALGYAASQGVLPAVAVALIALAGWRGAYAIVGAVVVVAALPALVWLLRGRPDFTRAPGAAGGERPRAIAGLRLVVGTRFFWCALPILLFMPFASTALVFHIQAVAVAKGWDPALAALGFTGYAAAHAVGLPLAGALVDRFGGRLMLTVMNLPFFAGAALLASFDAPVTLLAFLSLLGLSSGLTQTAGSAVWAEVYGVAQLGTIRSFAVMLMVAGTAMGPAVIGLMLDRGIGVGTICACLIAAGLAATALVATVARPNGRRS